MNKKRLFVFFLIMALCFSLIACGDTINNSYSESILSEGTKESSGIERSNQDDPYDEVSEPSEEPYVMSDSERYVYPLVHLGSYSWSSADDIDPDAFVPFYISLNSIGVELDKSGGIDQKYGNYMFPADSMEATVQQYFAFDVPPDYIRTSQYYDAEKNAYWTGGIGSVVDQKIISESQEGDILTIHFESSITLTDYNDAWNCIVKVDLSGENHRYVSFESDRKKD